MLNENLQKLRKAKGLSQEELATKLSVVRQTISKWEKGLSVPDSEMLVRIAEALDVSVNTLLGETVPDAGEDPIQTITAKLEVLNEQFARQNEARRKRWQCIFALLCIITVGYFAAQCAVMVRGYLFMRQLLADGSEIIGGADGPTAIFIAGGTGQYLRPLLALAAAAASLVGLYRTRKR